MNNGSMDDRKRVCIYGEAIGGALAGDVVGGAELQGAALARALACEGLGVTVVDPQEKSDSRTAEGVVVRAIPFWNRGIRGLRMFTHRIPSLSRTCLAEKPSVYYVRGFSFIFLPLLLLAKLTGARFALGLASDLDVSGFRNRYVSFYRKNSSLWDWISTIMPNHLTGDLILHFADVVYVQHPGQAALIRRETVELPNIVSEDVFEVPPAPERKNVLLVGTLGVQKGLREFLPVITQLAEITFEFVGEPAGREGAWIEEQLRQCPNVVLHGKMRRTETLERIAAARVLLNVSPAEGFPNTFLEAWAVGTPVLSLYVDPGGVMGRYGLGLVCGGDLEVLIQALRTRAYEVDPGILQDYVRNYHTMTKAAQIFVETALLSPGTNGETPNP